jgi:ABC-2 type transport system ATP-binding protein
VAVALLAEPTLRLHDVHKRLGGRAILRGATLEMAAGDRVALLGANGSGKSTLLRIAGAASRPDSGDVQLLGVDARKDPDRARRHASCLLQDAPVYAELTPHEHLAWWGNVWDLGLAKASVESATIDCGLGLQAHRPAGTLSRGQQQRLAIAMALLPTTPLLLLDEPFTALDTDGIRWLEGRLQERAGAVLMALHDTQTATRLARRVVRLDGGRIA